MIQVTINLCFTSGKVIERNSLGGGRGMTANLFTKLNSEIQLTYTLYFFDVEKNYSFKTFFTK